MTEGPSAPDNLLNLNGRVLHSYLYGCKINWIVGGFEMRMEWFVPRRFIFSGISYPIGNAECR